MYLWRCRFVLVSYWLVRCCSKTASLLGRRFVLRLIWLLMEIKDWNCEAKQQLCYCIIPRSGVRLNISNPPSLRSWFAYIERIAGAYSVWSRGVILLKSVLSILGSVKMENYTLSQCVVVLGSFWVVFPFVLWEFLQKALPDDLTLGVVCFPVSSDTTSKYPSTKLQASGYAILH